MLLEGLGEHVLVGAEGDVADEEGVALGALLVAKVLGAGLGAVLGGGVGASVGKVNVEFAAVEFDVLLGLVGLGGILGAGEFNVSEAVCSMSVWRLLYLGRWKIAYPRDLPLSRSVTMRTPVSSPKFSNSDRSHSSSTFHDRLPTKRFPPSADSTLDFLGAASSSSSSALRFLLTGFSASVLSSDSSSESESDESSDSDLSEELSSLSSSEEAESCDLLVKILH